MGEDSKPARLPTYHTRSRRLSISETSTPSPRTHVAISSHDISICNEGQFRGHDFKSLITPQIRQQNTIQKSCSNKQKTRKKSTNLVGAADRTSHYEKQQDKICDERRSENCDRGINSVPGVGLIII